LKVLVLGATGMAGHTISLFFSEVGHDVTALSRRPFRNCRNIVGEITNYAWLNEIIEEGNFDAIINAVGILNAEAENNKHVAVQFNSYLPHHLVNVTKGTRTRVVHLSTDCVFSGRQGGYKENSFRDGESFYGRSKALGEIDDDRNLTLRTSIVGPDMDVSGAGLLNWFMHQHAQVSGYTHAIWTGVTTLTLAQAIEKALEENITGLYHLVNKESISKYDLLMLFNKHMQGNSVKIVPREGVVVDKSLISTRDDFSFIVPGYEQMVVEITEWIRRHALIYTHYSNLGK